MTRNIYIWCWAAWYFQLCNQYFAPCFGTEARLNSYSCKHVANKNIIITTAIVIATLLIGTCLCCDMAETLSASGEAGTNQSGGTRSRQGLNFDSS